jgi:CubicO group peptidase (beta-lactamase class C family)
VAERVDGALSELTGERLELGLGRTAKLLCSAAFVVGRDVDAFIRDDLLTGDEAVLPWREIDVRVDRDRHTVTLAGPGGVSRSAKYHPGQGCTILPPGRDDVYFTPTPVVPDLPDAATTPWPLGDLLPDEPAPGVDEARLAAALDAALDDARWPAPMRTRGLVVCHRGRLLAERYAPGFDKDTRQLCWSAGKSITAALIGVLVRQGHFAVDDPAPIAEWRGAGDPRGRINIRHLLNMSSGLECSNAQDDPRLTWTYRDCHGLIYTAPIDVFAHAISRPSEHPPNTVWRYRNCDPLSLGLIVRRTVEARGEAYPTFPQRALFDRIGIRSMVLEPDPWGNFIMTGFEYGTPRDWARFGLLHLWDGLWRPTGERVLPGGWARLVATPATAAPDPLYAGRFAGGHYGGQFWLNAGGRWPAVPRDAYWAAGAAGQLCLVVPSREAVLVRMGHTVGAARDHADAYYDAVFGAILAALGGA